MAPLTHPRIHTSPPVFWTQHHEVGHNFGINHGPTTKQRFAPPCAYEEMNDGVSMQWLGRALWARRGRGNARGAAWAGGPETRRPSLALPAVRPEVYTTGCARSPPPALPATSRAGGAPAKLGPRARGGRRPHAAVVSCVPNLPAPVSVDGALARRMSRPRRGGRRRDGSACRQREATGRMFGSVGRAGPLRNACAARACGRRG